ncbi:MAG: dihydrodipicolinate synthase family protein [Planctomycetaceae bacterium]|nr:dihydrodipicolinate synthase family protein [Gemmataceae bacterium]PHX63222.1 MAG: dihydrodipicolinate synthase family protein [Planctomycetaceae bacterium]
MKKKLAGVLPIVHVPFEDDGTIDEKTLKKEIDWIFSVKAQGLGTGMVSEILRLTFEERISLTNHIVQFTEGRGATFAGVGAESTKQALVYAKAAEKAGCDGIMAIPPVTTSLPEEAVLKHFRTLAEEVNLPLIVQDASGYVGQAIPLRIYIQLLELYGNEKILFKPEASPIGPNLSALRDASSGKAKIFEGSGGILLVDSFRRGITGTMPGVDLLDGIVSLWNALVNGDEKTIYRIYFPICAIVALQLQAGLDGFLAIEKFILKHRGIFKNEVRRSPYSWDLDLETSSEILRLLQILDKAISPEQS